MGARKLWLYVGMVTVIIVLVGVSGCSKSDPLGSGDNTSVNLAVSFSKSSSVTGLLKSFGNISKGWTFRTQRIREIFWLMKSSNPSSQARARLRCLK